MRHNNNSPARSVKGGAAGGGFVLSNKIQAWHLDRLAIVYVRQSNAHQVAENRESAETVRPRPPSRRTRLAGGSDPRHRRRSGAVRGKGHTTQSRVNLIAAPPTRIETHRSKTKDESLQTRFKPQRTRPYDLETARQRAE
jgi:hypothetical protein